MKRLLVLIFLAHVFCAHEAEAVAWPLTQGRIFGHAPEAWIGDVLGKRVAGKGRENISSSTDVDFIKVRGEWYKIKGPVYITNGGKIAGWHRRITLGEEMELGRWLF